MSILTRKNFFLVLCKFLFSKDLYTEFAGENFVFPRKLLGTVSSQVVCVLNLLCAQIVSPLYLWQVLAGSISSLTGLVSLRPSANTLSRTQLNSHTPWLSDLKSGLPAESEKTCQRPRLWNSFYAGTQAISKICQFLDFSASSKRKIL